VSSVPVFSLCQFPSCVQEEYLFIKVYVILCRNSYLSDRQRLKNNSKRPCRLILVHIRECLPVSTRCLALLSPSAYDQFPIADHLITMEALRRLSSTKLRPKQPFDETLKEDAVLEKLGYQQG
jgi:hypothetical protein